MNKTNGFSIRYTSPDGWRIYRNDAVWCDDWFDSEREAIDALALRRPLEATALYNHYRQ